MSGKPPRKLSAEEQAELVGREVLTLRDAILKNRDEAPHDAFRRAMIDLLRNGVPINMPLSQYMRDQMAAELEQLWWPKGGRPALASPEALRYLVNRIEAFNREDGVDRPRTAALEDAMKFFGYRSVGSVRKAMQPSRRRRPK